MSVFIDRKFLLQLSPKLHRFAQKKADLYNFRCPLCGDSQKNITKSRGYVYAKKNNYFYMCHNCGASTSFYNFLQQVDPTLLKEYALERYKNGDDNRSNSKKPDLEEFKSKTPVFKEKLTLPAISELPDEHYAKQYVINRKIPEERHSELYYAEDYKKFVESTGVEKDGLIDNDPRLVIPFYDEDKNLVAFQGRALGNSKLRYITVKIDRDNYKVYGMDRIDKEKKILVVEGPIDSMFLENCVATADSNLPAATKIYNKADIVLIYDNEPRNKDIVRQIEKAIEEHYNVVIWPEMLDEKDINDMIINGFTSEEIQDIITKHTYQNLRAKMEFINWKKV
jgi:transcription elongation factor Elf1